MSGSDSRPVDDRQRRIAAEEIDRSLCLEAGAGTGKTTLLVERYISIIKSGNAPCAEIVAITFTDAAANEMKERIRRRIEEMIEGEESGEGGGAEDSGFGDEIEQRLRTALRRIERAPISTIHSFASSVIRDYPVEAGVDPDFNLSTGVDNQLFMEDCWKDFLSEYGDHYREAIGAFLRLGGSVGKLNEMADNYYHHRFERYVSGGMDSGETYRQEGMEQDRRPFCQIFREYVEKLSCMAEKYCADESDRGRQEINKLNQHLEAASALRPAGREEYLLKIRISRGCGSKKNWKPEEKSDQQKEMIRDLSKLQSTLRSNYLDGIRDRLEVMLDNYLDYIENRKRAEESLDFDDLLIRMRQLLNNPEVVNSLRRRYRYILVDEFQDTNSIQAEIIFILAGLDDQERQTGQQESSLFIVGDPKQSIYRFRKADVEVYERVKEVFSRRNSHLKIRQNFRSGKTVLDWVNKTFSNLIRKPETGRFQPEYEAVLPHRDDRESSVIMLELDRGGEKLKSDELREKEGIAVVRAIRHLVESGHTVRDLDTKKFRPVRYSDIALIFRATTGIEYYENPLKAEEIPYLVSGGSFFFTAQEVRDLANAVWAVENHWDRVYLVAVLRSLLFGFSDEDIFLFMKAGGELDYLSGRVPQGEAFDSFREAFSLIRDLHLERNRRGAAGTVKQLISRTGYREANIFRSHSRQRLGNIDKVIRKGREFDNGFHSFRQFALWFRDQEKLGTRENEYSLMDEDQDAVRLMSIHKSKGQQFPVVFMINLHQRIRQGESVYVEGGRRIEFRLNRDWRTGGYGNAEKMDRERDTAEIKRLLYVSATRAGDLLIIPDVRGGTGKKYIGLIEDFLPSPGVSGSEETEDENGSAPGFVAIMDSSVLPAYSGARTDFRKVPPPGSSSRIEGDKRLREWMDARQKLLETGRGTVPVITPSSEKESAPADVSRDSVVSGAGAGAAAAFGTAFHRVMELMDLDDTGGLERLAELVARENAVEPRRNELSGLVRKTVDSEFMGRVLRSERVMREVPFTIPLQPGHIPGSGRYLSGKIDLLFLSEGKWAALDYKTDNIDDPEERLADYRPQGAMYMAGMKALGIDLAGGVIFYFVRPGRTVTLPADELSEVKLPDPLSGII